MFLHLSVILFTRGAGVSVQGGFCPGGSCPRWSLSRGALSRGSLSRWSLSRGRGLCPGGLFLGEGSLSSWSLSSWSLSRGRRLCPEGRGLSLGEGSLSWRVSVQGSLCQGPPPRMVTCGATAGADLWGDALFYKFHQKSH